MSRPSKEVLESYKYRSRNLRKIGFDSYQQYLASDLWKSVRAQVFAEKGRGCSLCKAAASCVHHNRYNVLTLLGQTLVHLHPLCQPCHQAIEFDPAGKRKVEVFSARIAILQRASGIRTLNGPEQRFLQRHHKRPKKSRKAPSPA